MASRRMLVRLVSTDTGGGSRPVIEENLHSPAAEPTMIDALSPVSRAAERMRRHRQRRRRGLRCVTIEVRRSEVDTLIARRLLAPEEWADRSALRKAIHRFLDMTLGRTW